MQCILCQPSCILHFFQTCGRLDCHALFEVAEDWPIDHWYPALWGKQHPTASLFVNDWMHCTLQCYLDFWARIIQKVFSASSFISSFLRGHPLGFVFAWRVASHGRDRIDALSCAAEAAWGLWCHIVHPERQKQTTHFVKGI